MLVDTRGEAETLLLGEKLGKLLGAGDIVLLFGELGSGKTLLTRGIAKGLGLEPGEYVRSPSFTLVNEYRARLPIYHIDLYRMESFADIENLGLEEALFGAGVTVVEWAEKLFSNPADENTIGLGIQNRIEIRIAIPDDTARQLEIRPVKFADRSHPVFSLQ